MSFETDIVQKIQSKILSEIKTHDYTKLEYNQKQVIPQKVLENAWNSINWDEVLEQVRQNLQVRVCNSIIGSMETEIKTDVKNLLSISGVREKLRVTVYPELMKVLNSKK